MGLSSIQHNMLMANADRRMKENAKIKTRTAEKLASGYKINRAADDAAGLSMSEKMRFMVRGLQQGTANAMDGISWVQIGDGSLEEAHSMLHRMTELAIKSSNGTYTDDDRAMMQAEFAHLQEEIDRLTDNTTFNEQQIFQDHEWPYHSIEGSTYWSPTEYHDVREGDNELVVTYAINENDPLETVSIKVAAGRYTTKELVDEIDTQLEKAGLLDKGIRFQYTEQGFCNLNLEGGRIIDEVSGGLSYLLYDNFNGGTLGALIGTTQFETNDDAEHYIEFDRNDTMHFQLLDPEDITKKIPVDIKLAVENDAAGKPLGKTYSKQELIKTLNDQMKAALEAAGKPSKDADGNLIVVAEPYGDSIKISSLDYIVSEFEGNMFTIDGGLFTSVFYDNIKYADTIKRYPATLTGGLVVRDSAYKNVDPEGSVFHFSKDDRLVLNPNGRGELVIDMSEADGKDIDEMVEFLQRKFDAFEYTDEEGNVQQGAGLNVFKQQDMEQINGVDRLKYTYTKESKYGPSVATVLARLCIQSTVDGPDSTIGINKAKSTAYAALFTSQRISKDEWKATFGENDGRPDTNDYLLGLRALGKKTVESHKNDAFEIQLSSGDWKTIRLDADTYADANALAAEIQKQVNKVYGADALKVTATQTNQIRIEAGSSDVKGIAVKAHQEADGTTNVGFQEIFQGVAYTPKSVSGTPANDKKTSALLPEVKTLNADGTITIENGKDRLMIRVDGEDRYVDLGVGNWTKAEIEKKIEDAFKKEEKPYQFDPVNVAGQTKTAKASAATTRDGKTVSYAGNYASYYGRQEGYTAPGEGSTMAGRENRGAKLTFATALPDNVVITEENRWFTFKLNGGAEIKIDLKTLGNSNTRSDFAAKLQGAITKALGNKAPTQTGGVKVDLSSNGTLTLTAGINKKADGTGGQDIGQNTSLEMTNYTSKGNFIYGIHCTKQSARAELTGSWSSSANASQNYDQPLRPGFTGTATLNFVLTTPGNKTQNLGISITGAAGDSAWDLQQKINAAFKAKGYNLSASVGSYGITFDTTGAWTGDGYKLKIDTGSGKSTLKDKIYAFSNGKMTDTVEASATLSQRMDKAPIVFDKDQTFTINIDGTSKTVTINKKTAAQGGYSWDEMAAEIQRAIKAAFGNKEVATVRNNNGYLTFTTTQNKGKDAKIVLNYQDNSALRTIFGAKEIGGVDASFDEVGGDPNKVQLRLTRTPYDASDASEKGSISVMSRGWYYPNGIQTYGTHIGGSFINDTATYSSPSPVGGYHSTQNSFMQGVPLSLNKKNGKIEINEYNDSLSFYYSENYGSTANTPHHIEFTLDHKAYSESELVQALQEKIDDSVGADKLKVLIEKGGIRIETVAKNAGKRYRIHMDDISEPDNLRPGGSFYKKVLCGNTLSKTYTKETNVEGSQSGGHVYAMGRQDIKNTITKIQRDGNDELSLQFETPDGKQTLEMRLDPGYYNGDELVKMIQEKLDQALEKAGMKKGLIEVLSGYVEPGSKPIVGSIPDRALVFKLSNQVPVPKDGKYVIDKIGGTAAFSVFYATDGDIARAYVRGGKDITNGVEIKEGQNTLSMEVDGKPYEIKLDAGKYTANDLIDHINEKLENAPDGKIPLKAYLDGGRLKLMHSKYGKHTIKHLGGGVKNDLLFRESGEWAGNQPMRLRVSGAFGDWIEVDKPWMDTSALGINTLTIEKYKNAQKAITRLKAAVTKVSSVRSYFGAMQNRLESTVRNNMNKSENTAAAESRIRDADFADEAVKNSIHSILEQSGVSIMTQVMQNSNLALQLLQ